MRSLSKEEKCSWIFQKKIGLKMIFISKQAILNEVECFLTHVIYSNQIQM